MADKDEKEILIPEVLPPDRGESRQQSPFGQRPPPRAQRQQPSSLARILGFFSPIFTGVLLDSLHDAQVGRAGETGLFIGALLGFWFGRVCNFRLKICLIMALLGGYYVRVGIGGFFPLATVAGIFFALKNHSDNKERNL